MTVRFATQSEIASWNTLLLANPDSGNVFQSRELALQKQLGGWTPLYIVAGKIAVTVLEKTVPGIGKLWYIPKGPGVSRARQLDDILEPLKQFAKNNHVFAIKIEPELPSTPETVADFLKLGLVKVAPIQPNASTVTIDLTPPLNTIMASLNQKGRHAIRRAERDGVTIRQVATTDENCRRMFDLLAETAQGAFRIRRYEYYKSFWQRFGSADMGQLFFAYVGDRLVAGAYAIVFGTKSTYKDGASVRERTVYGASHLLQWHVIEWAKSKGATVHDLCGTPPSGYIKDPNHPHYGIGRFKTSFNKMVTDYVGAYDIVVQPAKYALWTRFGERLVTRIHRRLHHENYY
jgi:lipid II:glycine glycyltransferase (peptidoglycan interpeptide bridge formation enzyme)